MQPRIMYIECKAGIGAACARIGRVTFSRTGQSVYYAEGQFQRLKGRGFKANYYDVDSGEEFWISGCKRRGGDSLYGAAVEIDEDVREEYWTVIRGDVSAVDQSVIQCLGKY